MRTFFFENKKFRLEVGENAIVESLVFKESGEELLMKGRDIALFSETQLRPFNNEVKLMYMNKRTTFQANSLEIEGNKITHPARPPPPPQLPAPAAQERRGRA